MKSEIISVINIFLVGLSGEEICKNCCGWKGDRSNGWYCSLGPWHVSLQTCSYLWGHNNIDFVIIRKFANYVVRTRSCKIAS